MCSARPVSLFRFGVVFLLGAARLLAGPVSAAGESPQAARPTITDPQWIWAMPSAQKTQVHPLHLEGRVNYYDWRWRILWLQQGGVSTYVQLADAVELPALKSGERVLIEGTIIPERGIEKDRVAVKVLRDYEPIEPRDTAGRINDMAALHSHIVTADAYVDAEQLVDIDHLRLELIAENRPVIGWVKLDHPDTLPAWSGCFIRLVGLYSGRIDPTATQTSIELFVVRQSDIRVTGTIENSAVFDRPAVRIDEIHQSPAGTTVRIRGRVESYAADSSIVVRDGTGEIQLRSMQRQRLPIGTRVEAVGRVAMDGAQWLLRDALYRRDHRVEADAPAAAGGQLTTIDEIRQLSADEAAQHRPVSVSGMVTWSLPGVGFFFLQDVNAGIRVKFDPAVTPAPPLLKYLHVEGVTARGGVVPVVELKRFDDLGAMSPPDPKPVTYDQVSSGREDGQWVQVRGFVQRIVSDGDWRSIYVETPAGEFVGRLQSPINVSANPGSLIRMRGVCDTTTDASGRITAVVLHVPFIHNLSIEEDAPVDPFALPLRSVKSVIQLSGAAAMTRVRVEGTVTCAVRGRHVFIEDHDAGLLLLSRSDEPLVPGDRIEAVGILGREGVRAVLREAVFRRAASGPAPKPARVENPAELSLPLDSRLVRVRGTLIDVFRRPGITRLTLQSDRTMFDAVLDHAGATGPLALGEGLDLTGIYRIVFDDSHELRGFQLQLRSPADIAVVEPARFWTVAHALVVCAVLAGCILLGLGWITALRRRVHRQTGQIRQQLGRQAQLEAEVHRAARLESLGTLAGGIAHDFNNLLTIVLGNASLALMEANPEQTRDCLREIERGARRARELTQQLLTFAKGGSPLRRAVALPEVIREAADFVLQGTEVRSDYDFAPDLWNAHVDRDQIAQAIRHLARNAVQAMPAGGTLRISLHNEQVGADARPGLAAGRYLKLVVADTGGGIAPEVLPRIFDPYFSTRKEGGGLGLATVYSVVRKHQGRIEAKSPHGHGAAFHLWLPASAEAGPPAPLPRPQGTSATVAAAPVASRKPRVLAMDDEESIRRVLEIVLQRLGVEPILVADGAAALDAFDDARASGRPVDLLILDLTIPNGIGGRQVIETIRRTDTATPAIVASGYSNDPVLSHFGDYGFQAMAQKPFDLPTITAVIGRFVATDPPVSALA